MAAGHTVRRNSNGATALMTPSVKNAEALCRAVREYGLGSMQSVEVFDADAHGPRVRVVLVDGFTFVLPHDFNVEHFDTLIAIITSAKLFGAEKKLLEQSAPGSEN